MSKFKMTDPAQAEAKRQEGLLKNWIHQGDRETFEGFVTGPDFLRMAVTPAVLRHLATSNRDDWWRLIEDRVDRGVVAKAAEESLTWDPRPGLADIFLDQVRPRDQRAGTWRKAMFKGQLETLDRLERHWGTEDIDAALFTQSMSQKHWAVTRWLLQRLGDRAWSPTAVLALASRTEAPEDLKLAALNSVQAEDTWHTAFKQAARIAHTFWLDAQEARQDCRAWFEEAVDAALSQGKTDVARRYVEHLDPAALQAKLVSRIERNTGSLTWETMDAWCADLPPALQRPLMAGVETFLPQTQARVRALMGQTHEPDTSPRRRARP